MSRSPGPYLIALVLGALADARPAHATAPAPVEVATRERLPEESSDFYRELRRPGTARARTLLRHGLDRLAASRETYSLHRRAMLVEGGITRLRLAHAYAPDDPEVLFALASALSAFDEPLRDGTRRPRTDEALEAFLRLRALDPSYEAERVAFDIAVLHTKRHDLAAARTEYARAIETAFDELETITAHGNLAEVTMLDGDLEGALRHYERAAELSRAAGPTAARSLALSLFGAAVVLDRLGDPEGALAKAREATSAGGGLAVLRMEGVFFEPPHELHHYEGLGHLARAELAATPSERLAELRDARRSFERFLDEGGAAGPFATPARARLAAVDAELARLTAPDERRPRRRAPRPGR